MWQCVMWQYKGVCSNLCDLPNSTEELYVRNETVEHQVWPLSSLYVVLRSLKWLVAHWYTIHLGECSASCEINIHSFFNNGKCNALSMANATFLVQFYYYLRANWGSYSMFAAQEVLCFPEKLKLNDFGDSENTMASAFVTVLLYSNPYLIWVHIESTTACLPFRDLIFLAHAKAHIFEHLRHPCPADSQSKPLALLFIQVYQVLGEIQCVCWKFAKWTKFVKFMCTPLVLH